MGAGSDLNFPSDRCKALLKQAFGEMGDNWDQQERAYVAHNIYQNIPGGNGRHGGDAPFDSWINLPAVREALNVASTFPADVKWGDMLTPGTRPYARCQWIYGHGSSTTVNLPFKGLDVSLWGQK